MANATYTLDILGNDGCTNFNQSIAYGTSSTAIIASISATFSPASAISAIPIDSVAINNGNAYFSAVTTSENSNSFRLLNDGTGSSQVVTLSTIYNNNYLHQANVIVTGPEFFYTVLTAELSAGSADTLVDPASGGYGTSAGCTVNALTGLGDSTAPSGVTNFTANAGQLAVELSWTNPTDSDLSAVMVRWAFGPVAPASYTAGTNLYSGTGTSTQHTGLTASSQYTYSIFSLDNVGNWSALTASTAATATPYAENEYGVSWGTYLTNAEIRSRLIDEGII